MAEPLFFRKLEVKAFHAEQIEAFGGAHGLLDEGLLESALAAPENSYFFEETSDVFDLAATYVHSIASNHPFVDGNKRTAAATGLNFLKINGLSVEVPPLQLAMIVESLVTHSCDKALVAQFFFLGCLKKIVESALKEGPDVAPESYRNAKSDEEKHAVVTDYVTSKLRRGLIDLCQKLVIRPDRFDRVIASMENELFNNVLIEWRLQFGMPVDEKTSEGGDFSD